MDDLRKVRNNSFYYRLIKYLLLAPIFVPLLFLIIIAPFTNSLETFLKGSLLSIGFVLFMAFIKCFLEYKHLGYKIEGNSLSFKDGLLSVHVTTIAYSKITNISYDQGPLARLFSVGNINIDQEDSKFTYVGVDKKIADEILDVVANKSNIQPITSSKQP